MPKPSPIDGTTTDGGVLDRALHRRDVAEEAHRVVDAELLGERAQRRLERPAAGDVELQARHALARLPRTRAAGRCAP